MKFYSNFALNIGGVIMGESKGRSFFEKFPETMNLFFCDNDKSFVGDVSLSGEEKFFLEQGLLEIKEGSFEAVKIETEHNESSQQIMPIYLINEEIKSLYLINSLTKVLLPEKDIFREIINEFIGNNETSDEPENNFFNNFINAAHKKQDILFQKYDTHMGIYEKGLSKTPLTPCRIIYKRRIKLICWHDESEKFLYFVGALHKTRANPTRLLDEVMTNRFRKRYFLNPTKNSLNGNLLFYCLEMTFENAATLLGYSHYKLSNLLDAKIITASEFDDCADNNQHFFHPLKQYYTKRISLQEIYAHIKETDIENKEGKIEALRDYIRITREAIISEIETNSEECSGVLNKDPYFMSLRETNETLKNENEVLKLKYEELNAKHNAPKEKKETDTRATRKAYIENAIPVIIKIVTEFKPGSSEKLHQKDFEKLLEERIGDSKIGPNKDIITTLFRAIPYDYRNKTKGTKNKK